MKEAFRSVIWSGLEEAICRLSSANKFCKSLGSTHQKSRAQLGFEIEVGHLYQHRKLIFIRITVFEMVI